MNTTDLTYEQNSIVNAVLTLINSMDDKMRNLLIKRLSGKREREASTVKAEKQHIWQNYPISDEVLSMTFKHRKPIAGDYKAIF